MADGRWGGRRGGSCKGRKGRRGRGGRNGELQIGNCRRGSSEAASRLTRLEISEGQVGEGKTRGRKFTAPKGIRGKPRHQRFEAHRKGHQESGGRAPHRQPPKRIRGKAATSRRTPKSTGDCRRGNDVAASRGLGCTRSFPLGSAFGSRLSSGCVAPLPAAWLRIGDWEMGDGR